MLERDYQAGLIERLHARFPGCIVLKNDTSYQQGIPDLTFLWWDFWAFLEVKPRVNAREEPNQRFFVELAADFSFGAFIYPENEEEVLDGLQRAFTSRGPSRLSRT